MNASKTYITLYTYKEILKNVLTGFCVQIKLKKSIHNVRVQIIFVNVNEVRYGTKCYVKKL